MNRGLGPPLMIALFLALFSILKFMNSVLILLAYGFIAYVCK